jgi:hypothetical protein
MTIWRFIAMQPRSWNVRGRFYGLRVTAVTAATQILSEVHHRSGQEGMMSTGSKDSAGCFASNSDENVIRYTLEGLRGDVVGSLDETVETNLTNCARTAAHYAARMGLTSQDAVDALAAICLVIGERRIEFFENVFLQRMIDNPRLSPSLKLNRLVEIVIGTVPRPEKRCFNDNSVGKTA